jgi:hypothetical protein
MKVQFRRYAWSLAIALVLTVLVGAVASVSSWSAVGVLLAPGMLGGAVIFPEGIHSDWPWVYMAVAALMNVFFFSWPVLGVWVLIEHARRRNRKKGDGQARCTRNV